MFQSASWECLHMKPTSLSTSCCPGLYFPKPESQDQIMAPPRPGPGPDQSSGPGGSPPGWGAGAGRGGPGRSSQGQVRPGGPAGAAVGSQQLLPGHPEAARADGRTAPSGQGGRRARRPGTAHPAARRPCPASPHAGPEAAQEARRGPRPGGGFRRPGT